MKKSVCFALMACLGLFSQQAQAGVLGFGGTTASADSNYNGLGWNISLTYTANNAGPSANITAAVLTLGASSYLLNTSGQADTLTVNSVGGANNDTITFAMDFVGAAGVGTTFFALTGLTLNAGADVGSAVASDANIAALSQPRSTLTGGNLVVLPGPTSGLVTLTGSIPVPEPGSIALLSGLAIVVGRRYLKRRTAAAV